VAISYRGGSAIKYFRESSEKSVMYNTLYTYIKPEKMSNYLKYEYKGDLMNIGIAIKSMFEYYFTPFSGDQIDARNEHRCAEIKEYVPPTFMELGDLNVDVFNRLLK